MYSALSEHMASAVSVWSRRRFAGFPWRWTLTNGCKTFVAHSESRFLILSLVSFHSSRIPVKPSDTAKKYDAAKHNHVVFVRKNKFFQVALADKDGRELTAAELEVQVESVLQLAGNDKAAPVGALTSDNRDAWTDVSRLIAMMAFGDSWKCDR